MSVLMNIFMSPHLPFFPLGLLSRSPSPWVSLASATGSESKDKLNIPQNTSDEDKGEIGKLKLPGLILSFYFVLLVHVVS